jgi:hypothetical protein
LAVTSTTLPGIHLLNTNNSDRINWQRGETIDYKDVAKAPLMAYYEKSGTQKASQSDHIKLFASSLMSRRYSITDATVGGTNAGDLATDQTVSSTADLTTGMIALVFNGATSDEGATAGTLIHITAVDTDINYTNLSGGTIATDDEFAPIGFASADDATTGPAFLDREPETVDGYLAILKLKVQVTITERDTAVYAAEGREQEKIKRSRYEFMRHREMNAWFSRATTHVGSNKIRTSMGIHEQLAASVTWIDGGQAVIGDWMLGRAISDGAKYFDTDKFVLFHGQNFLSGYFKLAIAKGQTRPTDSVYGIKATTIQVAQYQMACVHSQLFDLVGEPFSSIAVGLDLSNVTNWYMRGEGKMQLKRHTDPKAEKEGETVSHMWRCQEGISITQPTRHFAIHSLIAAAS